MTIPAIYGALAGILAELPAIGKDSKNQAQGYAYRGLETITAELHPLLVSHKVAVVPCVLEARHEMREAKDRSMPMTYLRVQFAFTSLEDGSTVLAVTEGEGSDYGDKGSNKAMSAALKYALVQTFCIADFDDSDADSPEMHPTARPPERAAERTAPPPSDDDYLDLLAQEAARDGLLQRLENAPSRDAVRAIARDALDAQQAGRISEGHHATIKAACDGKWRVLGGSAQAVPGADDMRVQIIALAQQCKPDAYQRTKDAVWLPASQFPKIGYVSPEKRAAVPLNTICATADGAKEIVSYLQWKVRKDQEAA